LQAGHTVALTDLIHMLARLKRLLSLVAACTDVPCICSSAAQGSGGAAARNAHAKGVCQVEGCYADLKGLRDYHLRYKICEYHLKVSCW
jgi:hypothetical protein